jgi:predicted ATP-binding protein involved in virulence
MKLNKVSVRNLYGIFNHEIPVNNSTGITIVIGENGLGKTILLEIIEAFFEGRFYHFKDITFDEIIFEFDDGIKWSVSKVAKDDSSELILKQFNKNKTEYKPILLYNVRGRFNEEYIRHKVMMRFPNIRQISATQWEDRRTRERYDFDDIVRRFERDYYYHNQGDLFEEFKEELPKWFKERHDRINVKLIETQRLISEQKDEKASKRTVEKYAADLSKEIKSHLTESTELSSKLDRTYPNRLIERLKNASDVSFDDLQARLQALEKKRELLDTAGLIEIEKHSKILDIENPLPVVRNVLLLYVEDSFKKIEIFDRLSRKIEILLSIINKRFKHKRLYIDKEQGFLFQSTIIKNSGGHFQNIPVTKLSSGEQNELVLFYLLLFKTNSNSLILIDEPEVSLHISWQNCFIEDLKEIASLNNLDVVIATHSPDIISNNWDLKVELKGLE